MVHDSEEGVESEMLSSSTHFYYGPLLVTISVSHQGICKKSWGRRVGRQTLPLGHRYTVHIHIQAPHISSQHTLIHKILLSTAPANVLILQL